MGAPRAAVLGWLAIVVLVALTLALGAGVEEAFDLSLYSLLTVVVASSGLLIVSRETRQPIGRLFLVLAAWLAVTELGEAYGIRAASAGWPAGAVGEWVISWSWLTEVTLWAVIIGRFPDGHLPSPRFRHTERLLLAGAVLGTIGFALGREDQATNFSGGTNPFAVDAVPAGLLSSVGTLAFLVGVIGAVVALVTRYRRSRGIERLQLKWFTSAAALLAVLLPFGIAFWAESIVIQVLIGLGSIGLPIAAGVAILRYRLYDIDVVLNRALVYGALTAGLAGTYFASVLLLQIVLPERSSIATAVSTLAVAALFRPARARIQATVDKRFFRRRYDAAQTLAAFGARMRDEMSLDAMSAQLHEVVRDTLQPADITLWLAERDS